MSSRHLIQLGGADLVAALDGVEPIEIVAGELVARATPGPVWRERGVRLARWLGRTVPSALADTEWTVLEDMVTGPLCVLPTAGLVAGRIAAVAGLAARTLLAGGPVTVAVLGSGPGMRWHLVVLHHLQRVCRIVVWPSRQRRGGAIEPGLLDRIDLAGIRFTTATAVEEAVVAANLVVAVDIVPRQLAIAQFARGAVVVNATARSWASGLIGAADQVYVDDAALLRREPGRLGGRTADADLAALLARRHPGRTDADQVVFVELLARDVLDVRLAWSLHRVAVERVLGVRLPG